MKHLFRKLGFAVIMLCGSFQLASAQMQMPPIPVDKDVRIGHLDNGLTYYIRHSIINSLIVGEVSFRRVLRIPGEGVINQVARYKGTYLVGGILLL